VYVTGFTVGSLARIGVLNGTWGSGIKVDSDEKFTEFRRMAEDDEGGAGE
jgi:hypothetical protein